MRFRRDSDETRLERELRAQRPQPRDEFVQLLRSQIAPPARTRRYATPKLAFVAALTAALAASLGVAGALGAARGPVHAFSLGVVHLVSPPRASADNHGNGDNNANSSDNNSNSSDTVTTTTTSDGQTSYEDATPTHFPFQSQYGHRIPICWQGHIIYVTPRELIYYFFHGGRPARFCGGVPIHH